MTDAHAYSIRKIDLETGEGAAKAADHLAQIAHFLAREDPDYTISLLAVALGTALELSGPADNDLPQRINKSIDIGRRRARAILTEARAGDAQEH